MSNTLTYHSLQHKQLSDTVLRSIRDGRNSVPLSERLAAVATLRALMTEHAVTASPHVETGSLPLKRLRRQARLTRTELAEMIGVSRRTLFTYESSGRIPRIEAATAVAQVLGLDRLAVIRLSGAYLRGGSKRTRSRQETTVYDPDAPLIGRNLRAAREAAGLTQYEMAAQLGVCRRTYQRYELGEWRPTNWLAFKQRVLATIDAAVSTPLQTRR